MAIEHDFHVTEAAARQGRQQMFHRGHLGGAQIQRGAQRAVARLIRPQPDRLLHPGKAHVESRLLGWPKLNRGLNPTVEADAGA